MADVVYIVSQQERRSCIRSLKRFFLLSGVHAAPLLEPFEEVAELILSDALMVQSFPRAHGTDGRLGAGGHQVALFAHDVFATRPMGLIILAPQFLSPEALGANTGNGCTFEFKFACAIERPVGIRVCDFLAMVHFAIHTILRHAIPRRRGMVKHNASTCKLCGWPRLAGPMVRNFLAARHGHA